MAVFYMNSIRKDDEVEFRMRDPRWNEFVCMCIRRYATCDWGSVPECIKDLNDDAVSTGRGEMLALYLIPEMLKTPNLFSSPVTHLWITTPADHTRATVIIMPELI